MKKMFFKQGLVTIIIGVVFAIILPMVTCTDIPEYLFFSKDITELSSEELDRYDMGNMDIYYADDLVKLDVSYILDYSASNDAGRYYIVPFGEEDYITVFVENKYLNKFQQIYDGTGEYLNGEIDEPYWKPVKTTGVLYPIEDDVMGYTIEWFDYLGWYENGETAERIVPYTLYYSDLSEWFDPVVIMCYILAAGFLIASLIVGFTYEARFWNSVKKRGLDKDSVKYDMDNAENYKKILVGNNYTVYVNGMKCIILENRRMLWAFLFTQTTTHKTYGIKTGTTVSYSAKIICDDGFVFIVPFGTKPAEVEDFLSFLKMRFPQIVVGYSEELRRLFETDRNAFLRYGQSGQITDETTKV